MVIDDESFFREFLADNLSEKYDVRIVESEGDFFSIAKEEQPDLILLDRIMPKVGGDEICRQLKSDKDTMTIPVIMVTAMGEKEQIVDGLEAGADDYVAKPIYLPELLAKIRSQLRTKSLYTAFEKDDLLNVLEVYETVTTFHSTQEILLGLTKKVANAVGALRCSIIRLDEEHKRGCVVASNEDSNIKDLEIDLDKYPEVLKAVNIKKEVLVADLRKDPLTKDIRKHLKGLFFGSIAVIPIAIKDKFIGTLLLRIAAKKGELSEKDVSLCTVVARAAASVLENANLLESLRLANADLEKLATTDGLTNIYNHRYFYTRLEEEFNISARYNVPLACIMLDIDFFKRINDTYGHRKGDDILRELAAVITMTTRKTDIAARYGGEEFAIILPHTDEKGAMYQAERIRKAVRNSKYSVLPTGEKLTISLGIATCQNKSIRKAEDMVKYADKALYDAKKKGRDMSILYDK
jgi:two-component system cell cycle response regulator